MAAGDGPVTVRGLDLDGCIEELALEAVETHLRVGGRRAGAQDVEHVPAIAQEGLDLPGLDAPYLQLIGDNAEEWHLGVFTA